MDPPAPILSIEIQPKTQVINALVPISETFGYAADLRVRTRGRARHTMEFAGYQVRPWKAGNGDDDRTSSVREPRKPPLTGNTTAIALPGPDFEAWPAAAGECSKQQAASTRHHQAPTSRNPPSTKHQERSTTYSVPPSPRMLRSAGR